MTLSVPNELRSKMETFPEMNWSEVARQAFNQKISDLEFLKKFKSKSQFSEEDALKFGSEINRSLAKTYPKKRGN